MNNQMQPTSNSEISHLHPAEDPESQVKAYKFLSFTSRSSSKRTYPFLIAIIFSIFCTFSVFEVHMQSSRVATDQIVPTSTPPAKRAILFLSDGTKADSFLGLDSLKQPWTPNMRRIIENEGAYGVSYTALPTESKICSTSLLSGYYLDLPDLVNLYFFGKALSDHVINETKYAWSFGSEEIIHLFDSTGDERDSVSINPTDLGSLEWGKYRCPHNVQTLQKLQKLFASAETDPVLKDKLNSDKVIIFVHLICVDLMGHIFKPKNIEYSQEITWLDHLLNDAIDGVKKFYGDDKTAFFVTSDHGIKDTGVHADDSYLNVRTPFLAWGAGISKPMPEDPEKKTHDSYSQPWGIDKLKRRDLRQIDIAPLISSVLGIPFPVNNEGIVPLEYLDQNNEVLKAESIYGNAKQICSGYKKRDESWRKNSWFSILFPSRVDAVYDKLKAIQEEINGKNYQGAQHNSQKVINECLDEIELFKISEKYTLILIFTLSFLGWIVFGLVTLIEPTEKSINTYEPVALRLRIPMPKILWGVFCPLLAIFLWLKNSPIRYYGYSLFPMYFSYYIASRFDDVMAHLKKIQKQTYLWVLLFLIFHQFLSVTFKGHKKMLLVVYAIWAAIALLENKTRLRTRLFWAISTAALGYILTFPFIEVNLYNTIRNGWLALSCVNFIGTMYFRKQAFWPLLALSLLTAASGFLCLMIERSTYAEKDIWEAIWHRISIQSLPLALFSPLLFKWYYKPNMNLYMFYLLAAFSPLFVFQSLSYEGFFLIAFYLVMISWKHLETSKIKETSSQIERNAILTILGFIILYQVSYFGMGNQATIDSFKLEAGFRLLDGFNVPKLGAMMVLKFSIPFLFLNLLFQSLIRKVYPGKSSLNIVLFAISCSGAIIFHYFSTEQEDVHNPKLTISYPILCGCMLTANVIMSGISHLMMRNVKVDE